MQPTRPGDEWMRLGVASGVGAVAIALWMWGLVLLGRGGAESPRHFGTYVPLLASAPLLAAAAVIGLGLWPRGDERRLRLPRLRTLVDEWAEAAPARPVRERVLAGLIAAGTWNLIALPACLHYLLSDTTTRGPVGVVVALALLALCAASAAGATYYGLLARRVKDARVQVYPPKPRLGGELHFRVVQEFLTAVHVERARVGILCLHLSSDRDADQRHSAPRPV